MARVKKIDAEQLVAEAEVESLVEHKNRREGRSVPYARDPEIARDDMAKVVERVFREDIDFVKEFEALEKDLEIDGVLRPDVVREHLNRVERNALRAHRLYVCAKLEFERFEIDANLAIGAMRDSAIASLQIEKDAGKRSKQITDPDVRDRAATMYPDEWRDLHMTVEKSKRTVELMQKLSERWSARSYSLGAMIGNAR